MLKIKDNINLNELEKFGFKYVGVACTYKLEQWEIQVGVFTWLFIPKKTRIINFDNGGYKCPKLLDILYDLFQAGLVEKVED